MSSTLTQFDSSGALSWSESIAGFTGLLVTDIEGYIFALTDTEVRKYSSDGTFIDSYSLSFTPSDIAYGFDGHVYVCGETAGADGYIVRLTTALGVVATKTISSDPAQQIKADVYGNSYVTFDSFSIRKFSESLLEVWECDYFISVPVIAITRTGNIYASGYASAEVIVIASITNDGEVTGLISRDSEAQQILLDKSGNIIVSEEGVVINTAGGWVQRFDDSYWQHSYAWTGTVWYDAFGELNIRRVWGDVWPEDPDWVKDFRPTRLRVYGTVHASLVEYLGDSWTIRLYTAPEETYPQTLITDLTDMTLTDEGDGFWTFDVALDWSANVDEANIYTLWLSYSEEVHNIEFYSAVDEYSTAITMIDPSTGSEVWSYDIGLNVSSLITDVYGVTDTDSLSAKMSFSADIEILGDEAYVMYPTAAMALSQPTPEIDGYQLTLYPEPGHITFQSHSNITIDIAVTPGSISMAGNCDVIVPVAVDDSAIEFSGVMDTDDIEGYLTILKPTGQLQFSIHPSVWVFTNDAPQYGSMVLIDPPPINFAADNVDVNQQTIYVPTGKLSLEGRCLAAHKDSEEGIFYADLPNLDTDLYAGASLSSEFPSFGMIGSGISGHAGILAADLPSLSIAMHAGGQLEESFPRLHLEMAAVNNVLATISCQFPQIGITLTASQASVADLDITLPMFKAVLEATIGIVGTISGTLPKFSMGITALPGTIGDLEGTFRLPRLRAAGGPSGPGEIDAVFPMLDLELTSGEIDSDVLRYDWERIA